MLRSAATLLLLLCLQGMSQDTSGKAWNVGLEQDALPYLTGGYFAGGWVGTGHVRVRAVTARVNKPDFIVADGFTANKVTAYALVADYFLKPGWQGWWAGTGLVHWRSSIQTEKKLATAHFENWLWNGSIGYSFRFGKRFYASPWGALHLRIGGDKKVPVDDKVFTPPLVNPEASVKVGVFF